MAVDSLGGVTGCGFWSPSTGPTVTITKTGALLGSQAQSTTNRGRGRALRDRFRSAGLPVARPVAICLVTVGEVHLLLALVWQRQHHQHFVPIAAGESEGSGPAPDFLPAT